MNIFNKTINFLKEVKVELGKVSWSTRRELMWSTLVVIIVTAIMTVFIFIVDSILSKALTVIFS